MTRSSTFLSPAAPRSGESVLEYRSAAQSAVRGQRWMPAAHASSSAIEPELAETSTGSGRIVSSTRLPADSAVASEVES